MAERVPAVDAEAVGAPPAPLAAAAAGGGLSGRALWTLLVGNGLTALGVAFFLPMLPLFVKTRGGDPLLVGTVFAAGILARLLMQYPAGRLSDRYGRRPVLVCSLIVYALMFPLYLLPGPPTTLVGLRFLQSLAGGAFLPVAAALVGDLASDRERGRAYSRLRASDMAGTTVGPALGGLLAGFRLDAVFIAGCAICLAAAFLLSRLPAPARRPAPAPGSGEPGLGASASSAPSLLRLLWILLPVAALGMPIYWTFGTYDSVWSLYLTSRGASPFLVGLSFAAYALPIVLLGGLAGGLADRLGAVRAGTIALITFGALALLYPVVASVPLLIAIGLVEGALTSVGIPALQAEVSRAAPAGAQGRTQGAYMMALTVAEALGAVASGALYGVRVLLAFAAVTAVCLAGAAASGALRRARAAAGT